MSAQENRYDVFCETCGTCVNAGWDGLRSARHCGFQHANGSGHADFEIVHHTTGKAGSRVVERHTARREV